MADTTSKARGQTPQQVKLPKEPKPLPHDWIERGQKNNPRVTITPK